MRPNIAAGKLIVLEEEEIPWAVGLPEKNVTLGIRDPEQKKDLLFERQSHFREFGQFSQTSASNQGHTTSTLSERKDNESLEHSIQQSKIMQIRSLNC